MKHLRNIFILTLVFAISLPNLWGQNTSTQGKEFWLSFMQNGFKDHDQGGWVINQVLISAKRDCTGSVSNPLTGWSQEFNARAGSITSVAIPEAQGYHDNMVNETIQERGIKVQADDTISVYCTNIAHVSFDASFVLPVESLGDEYIIQTFDQSFTPTANLYATNNETSAFLIVATEDNTEIDITPSVSTYGGRPAGQTFTITMNAGETYHLRSNRSGTTASSRDLSGTRILAADCKKIAVFNGNTLTCIPVNQTNGFDHVFEQAMPLRSWGKNFVVTSSRNRNRDFIKITSSANDNEIRMNGEVLDTLSEGQSHTFYMLETEGSCFLQATHPCAVYLYNNSSYDQNYMGGMGDPSMVWIAPVEQRINEVTFSTFDHLNVGIDVHSINIIVNTEDIANVYLDGEQVSPLLFSSVNGNDHYSYARRDISHGVHQISCVNGFNAHVYGFGQAKGYAYLVGSNAIDLSTSLTLNNEPIQSNESFAYCANQPITFNAEVNQANYNILWDFGDGTTSDQNPTTHTFSESRPYNVSVVITTDEGGCTGSASNTTRFTVDASQQYTIEHDETCAGSMYSGYGFSNVYISNDTILARLVDNPIHSECQDSLLVYVTAFEQYHIPIDDNRCWQGNPSVYDSYGFSFEYDHPGTYDRQLNLTTENGCDSIIDLHLTVADRITHEFSHHECSERYIWDGRPYTAPGDYEYAYTSLGGCDSIVTLHLTMGMHQHFEFDTITCGVFEWNGQRYDHSGIFQQTFSTIDGCDSIVDCHLTLSGNVEGATTNAEECDSIQWLGTTYTEPGHYEKTFATVLGCDSIVSLNLDLSYTPDPTPIYPLDPANPAPHWVVTATEFQINSYDFTIWDNNNACRWDSIAWYFEDPSLEWVLEPDTTTNPAGKRCKIYVLEHIDDTIWVNARVYNHCSPEGIERRYWLLCSFYGIEDGPSANPEAFSVVPNPNDGQMTLNFGNLTGKIDIKVYDMRGLLVDHLQTYGTTKQHTMDYRCPVSAKGIYCFVVSSKEGTFTQKVIVQ